MTVQKKDIASEQFFRVFLTKSFLTILSRSWEKGGGGEAGGGGGGENLSVIIHISESYCVVLSFSGIVRSP